MSRKLIELEVLPEHHELFENIQKALGHDDPEETFGVLLRLGEAAITLSSAEHPEVHMFRRGTLGAKREVTCPGCTKQFIPLMVEDGYQELAVRLA